MDGSTGASKVVLSDVTDFAGKEDPDALALSPAVLAVEGVESIASGKVGFVSDKVVF